MTKLPEPATTATTAKVEVSLGKMIAAMREIDLLAIPTDWVLLSPDGRMWKGDPEKLLQVLMPHHPLLQMPSFGDML